MTDPSARDRKFNDEEVALIIKRAAELQQTQQAEEEPSNTMTLAEVERAVTLATLEHLGRHKEKTAATLGISLKTLYNRLKEYAADGDEPVSETAALDEAR